jgi:hypothetical protein
MESSEVTLDLDGAEKRRPHAEDLCVSEEGGDGAESMRETAFRLPIAMWNSS